MLYDNVFGTFRILKGKGVGVGAADSAGAVVGECLGRLAVFMLKRLTRILLTHQINRLFVLFLRLLAAALAASQIFAHFIS